jgi:hypothetical protein
VRIIAGMSGDVASARSSSRASATGSGSDIVVNRLDDITPDSACRVRVMEASVRDGRLDVVDQIIKLKNGGCHG